MAAATLHALRLSTGDLPDAETGKLYASYLA